MKKLFYLLPLLFIACTAGKNTTGNSNAFQQHIEAVKKQYAPDKRTALFAVKMDGRVLKGETNLPQAKAALLESLQKEKVTFTKTSHLPFTYFNAFISFPIIKAFL